MSDYKLGENAVLMRLSISLPGEQRQDPSLTAEVQHDKNLGAKSGKWIKNLYPKEALEALKKLDTEARQYHMAVTLPYDQGIGILPSELIMMYADKMREFVQRREVLRDVFLDKPQDWIVWGMREHNGTFDYDNYPGLWPMGNHQQPDANNIEIVAPDGKRYGFNKEYWRQEMAPKFAFETVPLPVPQSDHFTKSVASLLGVSTEKIDMRVKDAAEEARRELLRRLLDPVQAMAKKLGEQAKGERKDIVFRDTLVSNLQDIARIGEALNISKDPAITAFVEEVDALSRYSADTLRDDKVTRAEAQKKADELAKRMAAYKI